MNIYITEPFGNLPSNQIKSMRFWGETGMSIGFKRILFTRQSLPDFASESGDIMILQLPTGMGAEFEKELISHFCQRDRGRLIIFFYSASCYETGYDLSCADLIIVSTKSLEIELRNKSFNFASSTQANLSICPLLSAKKLLLSSIDPFYSDLSLYPVNNSSSIVQVVFALHDKSGIYSAKIGTVMLSISRHTSAEVCFHILSDETLSAQNRYNLSKIASDYGNHVAFHYIDKSLLNIQNKWLNMYSVGSLFRLQAADILTDLSKVIYLDADLLFCRDIEELWNTDMTSYALAGVNDVGISKYNINSDIVKKHLVSADKYINSGVLIMNLDMIRSIGNLQNLTLNYIIENKELTMPDQDALNVIFKDKILLLDPVWNYLVKYERINNPQIENMVYHFVGQSCIRFSNPAKYEKELLKTSGMTPWGQRLIESDYFSGMYSAYDKIDLLEKLLKKASIHDMRRFFYGYNSFSMQTITQIMNIDSDDCFISTDPVDVEGKRFGIPVKDFDELTHHEKGTYIVIVLPDADSGTAMSKLDSIGLKNGEDYFVIPCLLTASQGGYVR